ncbi:hypothetical protein VF04_05050 [Nostoc linckia z7]|uniref:Type II toxin-antitoxin system RelE/ParE family toxin n=1 Tax=Nostoc linckia z7 TaxID=1628745 RepID=A0ABX4KYH9_NOSLI|nr:type II toxin-antitoxin system RelE/ParE family toxin [Nostoc linckia]PHJ99791.1 hypothetical protein VF04_05050 [Nostoc linckia z7]PHK21394.1 hypothetical protein VF11_08515 [Nostoc linckia z14]
MSRYVLSAAAKQDLKDIKNYISRFNLGAASRFLDASDKTCRISLIVLIASHPCKTSAAVN